ncbi:hypothetical protein [Solidesulfovibrio carbinolicus]|uniref:Uncharacterized protein n=1 Tax=Solidesulfovibrio carbinolicus TaxID=296842 RepID=A0A4P6HM78_9BACT|nr:hypothetical protein [Solidesulfovibrio carbinolicus]QAZ68327.1 hypothetical protein C3Y92_14280 [Solidesulfovibrio carbinolicus]
MDFLPFFMPGERRPAPRAADSAVRAARTRAEELLGRATGRLDGLLALLAAADARDAGLVAALLAEDLDALADQLGAGGETLAEVRAGLGPMPGPEALAAFARRVQARLDALEKKLAARKAGDWRLAVDRYEARALWRVRTALIVCVGLLSASLLLGDTLAKKRRDFAAMVALLHERTEAQNALDALADLALAAKKTTGQPLFEITGENCTSCGCEGRDLRLVPQGDVCRRQWEAARERLGAAAKASPRSLARLARDPWGSPYLLNENEGESPDFPCLPDAVVSAGQNGLFGDADDIVVAVPNAFCPTDKERP